MFNKKIQASKPQIITPKEEAKDQPFNFPGGSKFLVGGVQYTVRRGYNENNADMRLVFSEAHQEQIFLLSHLLKMADERDFSILFKPEEKNANPKK